MDKIKLDPYATIADIIPSLTNPVEYVRGVLENLYGCKREYGNAEVRIGVTGEGKIPHYRTEMPPEAAGTEYPGARIHAAFNGRNHKKLVEDDDVLRDEHWSWRSMTLMEVEGLLGNLRATKERGQRAPRKRKKWRMSPDAIAQRNEHFGNRDR